MTLIKQLSREDVMFVAGETDSIYQHVGVLMILDCADQPDFNFERFREKCMERIDLIPHFRWKLHTVPMGLDRPYWVEDTNFSFDHHIKHIALPSPGDDKTLREVAAHLYSKRLDRNRPLWETWLIEGLEGGKFAYFQKFHHCMMDGEGAFNMMAIICDFEQNSPSDKNIDTSISEAKAGTVPSYKERSTRALQHISRLPGEAAKSAYDILRPKILEQFVWPKKPAQHKAVIPTASFNGLIGSDRAVTFACVPISTMKTIKSHFDVSLNDVLLALCSSAIRAYLIKRDELPDESLRTNIPVSLRTGNDSKLSNKVTNTTVTLGTNIEEPVARLKAIHQESEQAKKQAHDGGKGLIELFQMMPPILVSTLMESLPIDQAPQILGANVIVSNVRGSAVPMYVAGARLEKMFPMSIITAGIGINITCISYQDHMDCGIIVDPDLVPDYEILSASLEDAAAEYLALCKPKLKSRKQAAAKSHKKAAPKKATPKKATPKKATPKKAAPKKVAPKKAAPKKAAPKKATPKKATPKKATPKKAAPKKAALKKAAAKKSAVKKN
ncbi:MAG: wax ester/triacylglycerol synthase family O-acyltransferase [Halioglobus sp.]